MSSSKPPLLPDATRDLARFAAQLRYEDIPDPVPGEGEVLVRVRAAALNRGDLGRRGGTFPNAAPLTKPLIIGWDIAGDIVSIGPGVAGFTPARNEAASFTHAAGPAMTCVASPWRCAKMSLLAASR